MRRRAERFSAIPVRVDLAIDREELTARRGELLKRLVYRCGKTGETTFTLAELAEWLRGWNLTVEALRQDLKRLEADGWVRLDSPGAGKNTWRLTLVGAALELNSNGASGGDPGKPDGESDPVAFEIPTGSGREPTDRDRDTDRDLLRPQACRISGEGSLEDPRLAAERLVEAIRPEHRDKGTRAVVLKHVQDLTADDFDAVRRSLIQKRDDAIGRPIGNEGKYVNGALERRARKRAAPRRST